MVCFARLYVAELPLNPGYLNVNGLRVDGDLR